MQLTIRHLKHKDIDKTAWDHAIAQSSNTLVYAESWFLDIVSPGWEALVSADYSYVMPLPVKRKFGLPYLVQPDHTQQLGVFSNKEIDENIVEEFVRKIPYYSYELHLNEGNHYEKANRRVNMLLDLNKDFSELERAFSKNCKRNIKTALSKNLSIDKTLSYIEFLKFYDYTETDYNKTNIVIAEKLLEEGIASDRMEIYSVRNPENEVISALFFIKSSNRIINMLPVSNEEGRKSSAMFFLIMQVIKSFSGRELTLDFEGSMVEGVARFYRGFGAEEVNYGLIKRFRPKLLIGRI